MYKALLSIAVLLVIAVPSLTAQYKAPPAAPVPPQIAAARKIFISNVGGDAFTQNLFKRAGEPQQMYNHFYAAMQNWGRYELVSAPADAELVFEIRFAITHAYNGSASYYEPSMELTIVDTKTHFVLWSIGEPVDGAFRKATWLKNFDAGIEALMVDLKALVDPNAAAPDKKL